MRQINFLAQINFFQSGISCFALAFFFFFLVSLKIFVFCPSNSSLSTVRLQSLLVSELKTAAVLWTVNISAFTVNYIIPHYCPCGHKELPHINWSFGWFFFFFPLLCFGAVNNLVHSGVLHNQQHDESSLKSDYWLNWNEFRWWKMCS